MKTFYLSAIAVCMVSTLQAQSYTIQDLETQFLQKNYLLIANKLNIDKADAEIVQEKLWNNPTLSISEVNLWKTYQIEEQPYLFGKYGKNQQISVELEQLIETAGKRKKRVAIKQLEKNNALFDYEELLRELKKELRQSFYSLSRINQEENQLQNMLNLFTQMSNQYERQSNLQNVPKADFYRIQTELLGLQKEAVLLENEKMEVLNKLQLLTQNSDLKIDQLQFLTSKKLHNQFPFDLKNSAKNQNIGLKRQENELNLAKNQLILEKAQRTPDLTFQLNYDRGGNIMRDFFGVGVSVDLPVFNTNKGNIKAAQISIEQQLTNQNAYQLELNQSIDRLQNQLKKLEEGLTFWSSEKKEEQLLMVDNYKKHLQNKQVTLIEFIDFTQAYREAQQAYLELQETYEHTYEELQYIVGKDF